MLFLLPTKKSNANSSYKKSQFPFLSWFLLVLEGKSSVAGLEFLDGFVEVITIGAGEVSIMRNGLTAFLRLAFTDLLDDAFDATTEIVGDALGHTFSDGKGATELVLILAGTGSASELELAVVEARDGVGDGENEAGRDEDDKSGDDGEEAGHEC